MNNNEILDKLYLNPILEVNEHRKKLIPIRQKEVKRFSSVDKALLSSKSVPDIFKGMNGTVIMQNWNTRKNIPKDIGQFLNLPSLLDRKKFIKLDKLDIKTITDKPHDKLSLLEKIKLKTLTKKHIMDEPKIVNEMLNKIESSSKRPSFSKQMKRSNSIISIEKKESEEKKGEMVLFQQVPETDVVVRGSNRPRPKKLNLLKPEFKKPELIDFSTFKQHLFLKDNDFLYAKRVGGPVDFVLCSYQDINKKMKIDFGKISSNKLSNNVISKNIEYITISKNTIIQYQKGVPHLFSISEWTNNYVKYKKLLSIPLFKNFKNAGLFGLWKRYYRKKKRVYYTEKLKKKSFYVDKNLLNGVLEIRRIFKDMTAYDLFKLSITQPVYLNKFTSIYLDGLKINDRKLDQFRVKIKKLLSTACNQSYKQFKKEKNITLEDPYQENDEDDQTKTKNTEKDKKKGVVDAKKEERNNLKSFLKDAIPYAQDATRKRHFKKLLKFIRLIDFLFNDTKFNLIINSLSILDKRFKRLYESYENNWVDNPLITTIVVNLNGKISYAPSIELIGDSIFEHFIQGNISAVIKIKNFIDPQEFPQYMVCFEEVFEVSVDQNGSLSGRIREDDGYIDLNNSIKSSFDKCRNALDEKASELSPSLANYNKFNKINFSQVEKEADHNELNEYINSFKAEDERVKKFSKKINIGIFEFDLEDFLNQIIGVPTACLNKTFQIIPKILVRRVTELSEEIDESYNKINIAVAAGDVEAFIKLKKGVDECNEKRAKVEAQMDEISDLNNIINNYKEIKFEDFDRKKYDHLINIRTKYERFLDSMIYFIDQNIKLYRGELMVKIKKYDDMLNKIHDELNEEQINNYNEDTLGPLLFLEDKSLLISKASENKKIFQQQEVDIEMDPHDRADFKNLDFVSYEYELKKNVWKNLAEFNEMTLGWEKMQIMEIKVDEMQEKIKKWKELAIVATKDLDNSQVSTEFLNKVLRYEKYAHILAIIHNENIQKVDYLKDLLKAAFDLSSIDFNDLSFTLEKIINIKDLFNQIPTLDEINKRANEENRIKLLYNENQAKFTSHHIPLKLKVDEKGVSKYMIEFDQFDREQEFIQSLLAILNKEMLNPYVAVRSTEMTKLINSIYKYQYFLDVFLDYQIYTFKTDTLLVNTEFSKEFPSEYKKLTSENLTKNLTKLFKDNNSLGKYIDYAHERIISNLKTLINNYETNYKAIHLYLIRRRKECQEYYLLNDDDLIGLIELKDSYEIREILLKKVFPFIKIINPGKENDEKLTMTTKFFDEKINLKYTKASRTFKDGIECIQLGMNKKIKDYLKSFKKTFDNAIKAKDSNINPKDLILDLFKKDDALYQLYFICFYHIIYYYLEKTLEKENDAFDKMFDFYNEIKDEWKVKYINMLKDKENTPIKNRLIITIITILDYIFNSTESLLREDVYKVTEYTFIKVLQVKIDVDYVNIRLINYNFEYGNEYVGLYNDFFTMPQTEKTFLCILYSLHLHKSFVLYNNQSYFKKEILSMVSNILGRNIFYFTANSDFSVTGLNNILYGNMSSGNLVCVNNLELIQMNCLKVIVNRISEVARLLYCRQEEGFYNDIDGEKYILNNKKFNAFLTYDIDNSSNFDMVIPYTMKNNFRVIGINEIDLKHYLKLAIDAYSVPRNDEICKKIIFIIAALESRTFLNKNNLKEKIIPIFYDHIKNNLIENINNLNRKSIYDIVKNFLIEKFYPFMERYKEYKDEVDSLLRIILFDFETKDKAAKNLKNLKNLKHQEEQKHLMGENKLNLDPKELEYDAIYNDVLSKFSFGNENYKERIKTIYSTFDKNNSYVLLGPSLTGKTNAITCLREISVKLNKIDNDKFPVFNYVKIYHNSKEYDQIFIKDDLRVKYQVNNVFFKNMIFLFQNKQNISELQHQYKIMSSARNEIIPKFEYKEEKDKEKDTDRKMEENQENKEEKKDENKEEEKDEKKEEEAKEENKEENKEEKDDENKNENPDEEKKENEEKENNEEVKSKEIVKPEPNENEHYNIENKPTFHRNIQNAIIFDGSISPLWYSYLINLFDPNNFFTLKDADYLDLSKEKILYETCNISNVSPSFVVKQKIISFDSETFSWLNMAYAYAEKNYKTSKNEELKIYIRGLFENYGNNIIDFIEVNKLKCFDFCINPNYIIKNLINIFDAFLPDFDFTDVKIGRRNVDYIPRIDVIKRQTLCIFIYCSSWVMNLLTNFLIRNKIEKTVGDMFKSDDLKGPIFDYYLEEDNYTFILWSQLLQEEKYAPPSYPKNTVFYYNHIFVNTIENISYQYNITKLLSEQVPMLVVGRPCSGKTMIINHCLNELENNDGEIKKINLNITYKFTTEELEENINKNMDKISRKIFGDKYSRKTVVFIDDIHMNERTNKLNEYMRNLLNTKSYYDPKNNLMKYYKDFNIIASGNYCNTTLSMMNLITEREINSKHEYQNKLGDFCRFINTFTVISLNLPQPNFHSIYKPTFEFHLRTYIPNTSNITANQYLSVLFKLNESLKKDRSPTYNNLHYNLSMRDITRIVQKFNMFLFRGTNEFPEYLKKLFLYEVYSLYTNKLNRSLDKDIFKQSAVEAYNSSFKQDKLDIKIFDNIDLDENYIYFKNFVDVYEENKEKKYINPKDMQYVYIPEKKTIKNFIVEKIKNFYTNYYNDGGAKGTEEIHYLINENYNQMINYIIRILNLLNAEQPNLIAIGKDFVGKELLIKISLYIMRYNYIEANINLLLTKGHKVFNREVIIKTLQEVAYNNKKIFLLFPQELFENASDTDKLLILDDISNLLDINQILIKFTSFLNVANTEYASISLSLEEISERIQKNLHIIITTNPSSYTYNKLFLNYPIITAKSDIIYINEYNENNLSILSNAVFDKNDCLISNNLTKLLIDIFNFVKILYEEFSHKINIDLSINQRHYLHLCNYISQNYQKFKNTLIKNKEFYEKIDINMKKASESIKEKEIEIEKLNPQKEANEKIIDESRKIINEKNLEKNKIKIKRSEEEKPMNSAKELLIKTKSQLEDALKNIKESIKKSGNNLSKVNEKDILDCKNAWENFAFGKLLLTKIFDLLGEPNCEDFEYIKKNIALKHLKKLANTDYTKPQEKYKEIVKTIVSNPDFGGNDKFNKPYKVAGAICEYINRINKYNKIYDENSELVEQIAELEKKIEGHQVLLNKYLNDYKNLENEIINIESKISTYELSKANSQAQIDKIKNLCKAYNTFIELTNSKKPIYDKKREDNSNLLKYFDFYMIYIASYLSFAPILNYHFREKLKGFLLQSINTTLEEVNKPEEKDDQIKNINFPELMFDILDITGQDKELFTSSGIYNDFIKENFIFLHLAKNRVPFILDYMQSANEIVQEFLEFDKMQNFTTLNYSNYTEQSNEFKEKVENSVKVGNNLFINNIVDINKPYYLFSNFINQKIILSNSKKLIKFEDHEYEINDKFRLFLFKNIHGNKMMKIDNNMWFTLIFINFNLPKEELKERIFLDISKLRNELAFNGYKRFRNEKAKQTLKKIESEKKMIKTILQFDLSGTIDKLINTESLNEKYKGECTQHSNCEKMLEIVENKMMKQKSGLMDNYIKLCSDSAKIFKTLYKFCYFKTSFLFQRNYLIKILNDFIKEKISINNEIKNFTQLKGYEGIDDENLQRRMSKRRSTRLIEKKEEKEENNENIEEENEFEEEEYLEGELGENQEENPERALEHVNPVIKEVYIYNGDKDVKSLILFFYNKINSVYANKEIKESLLLFFAFINVNLESKVPVPFKQIFLNCHLFDNNFDECFEENEIEKSPINNISNKQWSILKKLNTISGQLFQDIFDNIQKNKELWGKYLEDSLTDLSNNYYLNNLAFPDQELEKYMSPFIKFIFFYIVKSQKREFLIQIFLKNHLLNYNSNPQYEDIVFLEKNGKNEYYSHMIKSQIEDLDITKAFKNFVPYKDHALILIAPSNNMNIYDKILYEYCYLKMFASSNINTNSNNANAETKNQNQPPNSNKGSKPQTELSNNNLKEKDSKEKIEQSPPQANGAQPQPGQPAKPEQGQVISILTEIKYKEIILENNTELTGQDFEYIRNSIKTGGVVIIKNAHLIGNIFNEVLKEITQAKPEEISSNFKFVLICNQNEVIQNKSIYEECRVINDNLINENDNSLNQIKLYNPQDKFISVKDRVLTMVSKIPLQMFTLIINTPLQFFRLFLRKLIYSYIVLFSVLESLEMKNPFTFGKKDFYVMCKFIVTYLEGENYTEEKYKNEFTNLENTTGYNYMTFITVLNTIFVYNRQMEISEEHKVNKLVNYIFNFKTFMSTEFYLDLSNIKISIRNNHSDLTFNDIYRAFNHFFSEEYENLLPGQTIEKLKSKSEKYTENIFNNVISVSDYNQDIELPIKSRDEIDFTKIYTNLTKFRELVPENIPYLHQEDIVDVEGKENDINAALFKKNKYGLFFNSFDESLLYEIVDFNKRLDELNKELNILLGMLKGTYVYDEYHLKVFDILGKNRVPKELNIFYEIQNYNKNIKFNLYKEVLFNRISLFKTWLKEGNMKCYHLPLFTNIELFMYCIKMHFSQKYYGENDYSKVTPEMINLKFITTRYATYDELANSEKDLNYYNSIYHNEIIWVDGLILNNATIDASNKHLIFNNLQSNVKQKLNIVGIAYTVKRFENADDNEQEEEEEEEEEEENEENKEKEENEEKKENEENKEKTEEEKKYEEILEENKEEIKNKNQSMKIYIYGNTGNVMVNRFYNEEPIGFFEFKMINSDISGQSFINENDIKITIDDFDDFAKNSK